MQGGKPQYVWDDEPKGDTEGATIGLMLGLPLGEDVGETNGVNKGVLMYKNLDFGHQR